MNLPIPKSVFSCCALVAMLSATATFADEEPLAPWYSMDLPEPKTDLSATPLAGKMVRYGYHTFWEVNKE